MNAPNVDLYVAAGVKPAHCMVYKRRSGFGAAIVLACLTACPAPMPETRPILPKLFLQALSSRVAARETRGDESDCQ